MNAVYKSNLDEQVKKFIINKNLGLIEKKFNKRSFSYIFENPNEAMYYQLHYGGRVRTFTNWTSGTRKNIYITL